MKEKIIVITLIMLLITILNADTQIGGGIYENTTLTLSNSPYLVISSITVFPNVVLTIEPGILIKFQDNTKLTIRGSLIAVGTEIDSIEFTSANTNPQASSWGGIMFETNLGAQGEFQHIIGSYAFKMIEFTESTVVDTIWIKNSHFYNNEYVFYGMDYYFGNYQVNIYNCLIENNHYGYIYAINTCISNSIIRNNDKAVHGWDTPSIQIIDSEISGHSIWGMNMSGGISGCLITNNELGLKLRSDLILTNNLIQDNDIGIRITSNIPIDDHVVNNCIRNNGYNVLHTTSCNIDLSNNCWGTIDENEIEAGIYDGYDNVDLGIVNYVPYITPFLTIEPNFVIIDCNSGYFEVYVSSTIQWTVYNEVDWLTVSHLDGYMNKTLIINYESNISYDDRSATITIHGEDFSEILTVNQEGSTSVQEDVICHKTSNLNNFPNPFNPSTTISFSIPNESKVELTVYNIKGQLVKNLVNDINPAGQYSVAWNGVDEAEKEVASGIYFYKLNVNGITKAAKKCLLLK